MIMADEDIVVKVQDCIKTYNLYRKEVDRLRESLSLIRHKDFHTDFHAVNGISFEVHKGECFGIIGTNGSGKSTTLKMLTGVLTPTSGSIEIKGKVSSLLELGAGFNMDYSGLENIFLNGMVVGYTKKQTEALVPAIEEFAEIGDFIYQPVKTYSSGMFARLAFAVAINVDPDVLIVDEALSVGDIFFQAKCYKKFDELKAKGKTIIFVTHDMSSVLKYCDRVMLLNKGNLVKIGEPAEIVNIYKKILANSYSEEEVVTKEDNKGKKGKKGKEKIVEKPDAKLMKSQLAINANPIIYGDGRAEIIDFGIIDDKGMITNSLNKFARGNIVIKVRFNEDVAHPIVACTLKNKKGLEIMGTNSLYLDKDLGEAKKGDVLTVTFAMSFPLAVDQYLLDLGVTHFKGDHLDVLCRNYEITTIDILSKSQHVGIVDPDATITVKKE